MLDRYMELSSREDKDEPNEFAEFYTRVKHEEVSLSMSVEYDEVKKLRENPNDKANNMVGFSAEEGYK